MKLTLTLLVTILFSLAGYSQVGVSTTSPNDAAELDVTSPGNNGGVLVPTITDAEMKAIALPAHGLFVFNTNKKKFMYNIGTSGTPDWTVMGELIRMTAAQITAIVSPIQGDLRYNTNTNTVWYYDGTNWQELNSSATPPY